METVLQIIKELASFGNVYYLDNMVQNMEGLSLKGP